MIDLNIPKYTVYSKFLAGWLLLNNCQLLGVETNKENSDLTVFKFVKNSRVEKLVKGYDISKVRELLIVHSLNNSTTID